VCLVVYGCVCSLPGADAGLRDKVKKTLQKENDDEITGQQASTPPKSHATAESTIIAGVEVNGDPALERAVNIGLHDGVTADVSSDETGSTSILAHSENRDASTVDEEAHDGNGNADTAEGGTLQVDEDEDDADIKDGDEVDSDEDDSDEEIDSDLPPSWYEYSTEGGKKYYYNPDTGVTQWGKPCLLVSPDNESAEGVVDRCGVCGGDGSTCAGCQDSNAANYNGTALFHDAAKCLFPRPPADEKASPSPPVDAVDPSSDTLEETHVAATTAETASERASEQTDERTTPANNAARSGSTRKACLNQKACNFDDSQSNDIENDESLCVFPRHGEDCDGHCTHRDCSGQCGGSNHTCGCMDPRAYVVAHCFQRCTSCCTSSSR